MKKRFFFAFIAMAVILSSASTATLATDEDTCLDCADALYELGLFKGTGTDADGNPVYDLSRGATRAEALVMLVRLLGYEDFALAYSGIHPFMDVPSGHWAYRYVAYCYGMGYTNGVTNTTFEPDTMINANMYLTLVLRALGYDDAAGDFSYDTVGDTSATLGLTESGWDIDSDFLRGDMAYISFNALFAPLKGGDGTLGEHLYQYYMIDDDAAEKYGIITLPEPSVVYANTAEELKNALVSNAEIHLSGTVYDFGEEYLTLERLKSVRIVGTEGAEIVTGNPRTTVVNIINCNNISFENVSIGHLVPENNTCLAEVVTVKNSSGVSFTACELYGCGHYGFLADSSILQMTDCIIRDCASTIGFIWDSVASFQSCTFSGNGYTRYDGDYAFSIGQYIASKYETSVTFDDCAFTNNYHTYLINEYNKLISYPYISQPSDATMAAFSECTFEGNGWQRESFACGD